MSVTPSSPPPPSSLFHDHTSRLASIDSQDDGERDRLMNVQHSTREAIDDTPVKSNQSSSQHTPLRSYTSLSYGSSSITRVDRECYTSPPIARPRSRRLNVPYLDNSCCSRLHTAISRVPLTHFQRVISLALPSIIGGILSVTMNVVNVAVLGHMSPLLLGGAALGNAFMLITGYTVLLGLCSSLDTLCSQAYGGRQHKLVGLIAQRAALAYTLVLLPILVMWWNTETFFLLAGQNPTIAAIAGEYVWLSRWTIFPILYTEIIKRYLQAQSIIVPQIMIAVLGNVLHGTAAYIFIYRLNLGIYGAAISLCIGTTSLLIFWIVYLCIINRRVARRSCPRVRWSELTRHWLPLYKLGLPGMLMLLFEWSAFEIAAIGGGWMGDVPLDTMVVMSNLCTLFTMAPSGMSIAVSTLVGHALGGGKPRQARMYARATMLITLAFISTEFVIILSIRHYLAYIFTSDPDVLASFSSVSICATIFIAFDGLQSVGSGVLRGVGLQSFGAKTNLFVYYMFGIPIGFILAFGYGVGVYGLVIGLTICVTSSTFIFAWRLARIDWSEESEIARNRLEEEERENEERKREVDDDENREREEDSDDENNDDEDDAIDDSNDEDDIDEDGDDDEEWHEPIITNDDNAVRYDRGFVTM